MPDRLTRRELLLRGAGLAAGLATLSLAVPIPVIAQPAVRAEDIVDTDESLRRGAARRATVVATPEGLTVQATEEGAEFTSAPLESPIRFTHLGLHWRGTVPPRAELSFEIRTGPDGSSWSPWSPVKVERQPDETPVGDYFGHLVYAGGARFMQYRVAFQTAGGQSVTLRRVTATVIDSPAVAAANDPLTIRDEVSNQSLSLFSREQWGADENYRFSAGKKVWPEMYVPAQKLVVHHTATRHDYASVAEAMAEVRAIYRYHAVTQRWGDIGYNVLVDRFGNLYEGRHGRGAGDARAGAREALSAGVVAGHVSSHNYGSAGGALLGDATRSGWPMPSASGEMWDALAGYSTFESGRSFIRPLAAGASVPSSDSQSAVSDFLRSDDLWTAAMRNVSGHRETNATLCPGDVVMKLQAALRDTIHTRLTAQRKGGVVVTGPAREATVSGSTRAKLAFSWSVSDLPAGWSVAGYQLCLVGWARLSNSEDIEYLAGFDSTSPSAEPRPVWETLTTANTSGTKTFTAGEPGHYTLQVRALLSKDGAQSVSAFSGSHTYLVKSSRPKRTR